MKIVCFIGMMSISSFFMCYAQEFPHREIDLSQLSDNILGFQDLDANYDELYENLAQILANPINLNLTNAEELKMLYILNEHQIEQFFKYRQQSGDFVSVYELQAIPGFDLETIHKLLPFVKVTAPES